MSTLITQMAPRVGVIDHRVLLQTEAGALCSVLDKYYGPEVHPADYAPHPDEQALRLELAQAAPRLNAFADEMKERLECDYCVLVFQRFGLDGFDLDAKRRLLYCFSLIFGSPTPTDKIAKRIVWDVMSRVLPLGHVPTISENSYEAELHTDTQYFPNPEKYVLLYIVKAANCGGGFSLLIDGLQLKARLAETEEGRWAYGILSNSTLPFRIPTSYTTTGKQETVEITYARIFSELPAIRYRKDTLAAGLAAAPDYDTPAVRRALTILESMLEDRSQMIVILLEEDSMLLTNNHEGLHGRTEFRDSERHLIRIRMKEVQAPLQTSLRSSAEQRTL